LRDVIIVGAGPAGSYLSHMLAKQGFDVLNLEEHEEIGRPVECTGVVTERVFRYVRSKSIANTVSGANILFPGNRAIKIGKQEKTFVIYRDSFDKDVSGMAIGSGADVRLGARVRSVKVNDECAEVEFRDSGSLTTERARIVIGADGANSIVRKSLYTTRPSRVVSTYQVDASFTMQDQDRVSVFLGKSFSNGFFGWAVPTGNITRIGLGSIRKGALPYFLKLIKQFSPEPRILGITGGPIPISYLHRTSGNRSLLVGDAGGIVKPLTGGGIYTGIVSSYWASKAVSEGLESGRLDSRFLQRYEKYWKGEIGRELLIDGMIQKFYAALNDRYLSGLYRSISSRKSIEIINSSGDIDYPSKLALQLFLRNPSIAFSFLRGN
jgi:digeranylgeranylglycerophospholipid reductase